MSDNQVWVTRHVEYLTGSPKPVRSWRVVVMDEACREATRLDVLPKYRWQLEALIDARRVAKQCKSELVVQGRTGRIRYRNSYGNDPKGRG